MNERPQKERASGKLRTVIWSTSGSSAQEGGKEAGGHCQRISLSFTLSQAPEDEMSMLFPK